MGNILIGSFSSHIYAFLRNMCQKWLRIGIWRGIVSERMKKRKRK